MKSVDTVEYLCHTCVQAMIKGKLPKLSIYNKLNFPPKPQVHILNKLEEMLVAPISSFFQMRELPSGGQLGIQGNVVNVPADTISTVSSLPRNLPESQTIPIKLKRRLRYKSHVMFENVRPENCLSATRYLSTKPLFMKHVPDGLNSTWSTDHISSLVGTEWNRFVDSGASVDKPKEGQPTNESVNKEDDDDNWSEHESDAEELEADCDGIYDTMLYPKNLDDQRNILSFAPSEGNVPVSSFGQAIEELSFPGILCGEKRIENKERSVPVRYSDICKSELRQKDRRAAQDVLNIFFKTKKLQMKQLQDKMWLSARRVKTKGKFITVKDVKDQAYVEQMVKLDDGYRIFRTLRGSPPYWESAKKDLFAMIRQLGLPTWFTSLSAAETRWTPLLQSLGQIIDHTFYSADDIKNMTWQTKCRLIRSDPVTTSRYFDYRVQKFFTDFLGSQINPLGKVKEYFYRIEFQQRGSPHVHALVWVEGAPKLDDDKDEEVEEFIDQYITTDRQLRTQDEPDYVKLQCHRHTHTCRKKNTKACRFNFPVPPMRKTCVMRPLPSDMSEKEKNNCKKQYQKIQLEMERKRQFQFDCDFDGFLEVLRMKEEQYILAIRSTLKEPKIFLKRDPACIRVNGYNNTAFLNAWQANMDIQFITNPYACVMYIVNYVSKGQ